LVAFLDTNVLVYNITRSDPEKAERCMQLLQRLELGELELATSELVIAEVVWILQGQTELTRGQIRDLVLPFAELPSLRVAHKQSWRRIFDFYCDRNVDFIDAYNAVWMERAGMREVYSYDHDFDRFDNTERLEP